MPEAGQETYILTADRPTSAVERRLMQRAVDRLATVALVVVGAWGVGLGFSLGRVILLDAPFWPIPDAVVAIATSVLSVSYALVTRLRVLPLTVAAGLGIAYVFAVPLVFAYAGVAVPWWTTGRPFLGVPWFCLWILLVPIIVPARFWATVATTAALTLVGPLALLTGPPLMGLPPATAQAYVDLFLPSLVAGFLAVMSARVVHELGQATREAQVIADRACAWAATGWMRCSERAAWARSGSPSTTCWSAPPPSS